MSTILVDKWTPAGFVGPQVIFKPKGIRQYGPSMTGYLQTCLTFDIPNGVDYDDGSKGFDRYILEGGTVEFYFGDFTIIGFVHVEHYGPNLDNGYQENPVYEKQRWIVKR